MVDWIMEHPATMSEASGTVAREWKFFLDPHANHRHIGGISFIGHSPALWYKYVKPQTEFSHFFSQFLDDRGNELSGVEPPSADVVMSEFVPPSERDLYKHLEGFGVGGGCTTRVPQGTIARLFKELDALENWGPQFADWMSTSLLSQVMVPTRTSPGVRWKKMGYRTKKEALMPATLEAARVLKRMQDVGGKYEVPPCGVAGRGKRVDSSRPLDGKDRKEGRFIVMPDLVRHLLGSMASGPYMHRLRSTDKSNGGVLLGMGPFSESYADIAKWTKGAKSFAFLDFKKFDQRVPRFLLRKVMKHISSRFDKIPGFKDYWESEFDQLVDTKIAMPNGCVYQKRRGVASGDPWTSIAGSYANWIILKACCEQVGLDVKVWTFGDDSVIAIYNDAPEDVIDQLTQAAWRMFGMVVSREKSYTTSHLVDIEGDPEPQKSGSFLSLYFLMTEFGVRPTRPLQDLYELFLVPERNRGTVEWECARTAAAYLTFYYNPNARYVLEEYWDWLHAAHKVPQLTGTSMDLQLLRELDIPWACFKLEWLTRLPRPGEVELMYKYGHTGFYPPALWGAWYAKYDKDVCGNTLSFGVPYAPHEVRFRQGFEEG